MDDRERHNREHDPVPDKPEQSRESDRAGCNPRPVITTIPGNAKWGLEFHRRFGGD